PPAAGEGLRTRPLARRGDLRPDPLGEGFDVALVFNLIHYLAAAENGAAFRKIVAALRPGGTLVIGDQLAGKAPAPTIEGFMRMLALNYFIAFGGTIYRFEEVAGWCTAAGCTPPGFLRLRSTPGQHLVVAQRAA